MFKREDWELFRSVNSLSHKSGVPSRKLAALVAKELVDNALDACESSCEVGLIGKSGFYVQDSGPGIDPCLVADLFSIGRPLLSSKLLRLPTRGALGNGLRVVAGAVVATNGKLIVSTQGQTLNLIPKHDGTTQSEQVGTYNGKGMRVEVHLGPEAGPIDLSWAQAAIELSTGENYKGKTSAYWYTSADFHELCLAADNEMTVRDLVSLFEGCTGTKAGKITNEAKFKGLKARDLKRDDAEALLSKMREESKPVKSERLGYVGNRNGYYAKASGTFTLSDNKLPAEVPYLVEVWAELADQPEIDVYVNRTPITGEVRAYLKKSNLELFGCGLQHAIEIGRKAPKLELNIITPHMPITTDGKAPDLSYIVEIIAQTIKKAVGRAKKNSPREINNYSQKDIVLEHLDDAIHSASGGGEHRYSLRQLYYASRPYVLNELGVELRYSNFSKIITDHENDLGNDLPRLYRDDRGTLYHPHLGQEISLGTKSVEEYQRPEWTFNKILYCEKEGFFEILKDVKWPEKHDCALLTSKGFASRAARDLLDILGDSEEEITFFCIHDADASGTLIYQSLQEETTARPGRRVKIINLGLEPAEAMAMGLEKEKMEELEGDKQRPVATYVETEWQDWLQRYRVELNAMSTPQLLSWLDKKITDHDTGKLIPPVSVMAMELDDKIMNGLEQRIKDQILIDQDLEGKTKRAFEKLKPQIAWRAKSLTGLVKNELNLKPTQSWRNPINQIAEELV